MILIRFPRTVARVLTALVVAGCGVLLCLALSGCSFSPAAGLTDEAPADCAKAGGLPVYYSDGGASATHYRGCYLPPTCPCVERFRPGAWDCSGADPWVPAEAPEGGAP